MLNISLGCNNAFNVELDSGHEHYSRAYIIVRSLLTSLEVRKDVWQIAYDEVAWLQEKLNEAGLREVGKTISDEAAQWLEYFDSCVNYNAWLKTGANNGATVKLLKGKIKATLYPDQVTAVTYALANARDGLFDAMGSGKSLISLSTFIALGLKKLLIVCPKGVISDYTRGVESHTYLKARSLPSGRVKALEVLRSLRSAEFDVLFVHPENLVNTKKNSAYGPVLRELAVMRWGMIVVDEFHKFKNFDAKRTKCVIELLRSAKDVEGNASRIMPMTGTPISESPANVYIFLKVNGFGRLPQALSFENYFTQKQKVTVKIKSKVKKKWGAASKTIQVDKVVGYKNLDFLKTIINRRSLRRTKAELKGFPDKTVMIRDVYLGGRQRDLYRSLAGQLVASLPKSSKLNLAQILSSNATAIRLRQLLTHPKLIGETGESAKFDELSLMLDELFTDPEQKAIVWTEYRAGVDLLYDRFNAQYGVVKIYGGVEINDKLISDFEQGVKPRIAAAIPAKGGEGLDFLARARTAFYIDRPYSFTLYSQSLDRVHRRVGSGTLTNLQRIRSQPATIVFLDAIGTIDEAVKSILSGKSDLAEALLTKDAQLKEFGKAELLRLLK